MAKLHQAINLKLRTSLLFSIGLFIGLSIGLSLKRCTGKLYTHHTRAKYLLGNDINALTETGQTKSDPQGDLMLVGVLTAKEFVNTRVTAIYETWAKSIHGKVIFFSGENSTSDNIMNTAIISLLGVTDTYPPQKKSFLVLKYMHDFYLNQFEWFVRADDDVYIKGDKLAKFLASVDSSKVYYIGQAGKGRKHERGKLGLFDDKTYCMGGPGIIISRATLKKVVPHISCCLQNLYSNHEDTEIGRCINQFANVSCTNAFEMDKLFYQNYKAWKGSFHTAGQEKEIDKALTLHPYKHPKDLYETKQYLYKNKITEMKEHMQKLENDINEINAIFGSDIEDNVTRMREDILQWSFVEKRRFYEITGKRPARGGDRKAMDRYLKFLDNWLKAKGRKNHQNLQHKFMYQVLNPILGYTNIVNATERSKITGKEENKMYCVNQRFGDLELDGFDTENEGNNTKRINFIIPLHGKNETFIRFMNNFEENVLKHDENVSLLVAFFRDGRNEVHYKEIDNFIHDLKYKYPNYELGILELIGEFQRAIALQKAASKFPDNALLFFVDIDCNIHQSLLYRIRQNTHQGKQVYFPIMFSQYDPEIVKSSPLSNESSEVTDETGLFSNNKGYWRMSSYGQVSMYKSDLDKVGGFNTNIRGWGKEDTELATNISKKKLNIFRAPDNGLIHIYHKINCDLKLSRHQFTMCTGTKRATYGSDQALSEILYNNPDIQQEQRRKRKLH